MESYGGLSLSFALWSLVWLLAYDNAPQGAAKTCFLVSFAIFQVFAIVFFVRFLDNSRDEYKAHLRRMEEIYPPRLYKVSTTAQFDESFKKLNWIGQCILKLYMRRHLTHYAKPRWIYVVGDYWITADIQDDKAKVILTEVGKGQSIVKAVSIELQDFCLMTLNQI